MAMGRQTERQGDLMLAWSDVPRSPGHVFYDRLQKVLIDGDFDAFYGLMDEAGEMIWSKRISQNGMEQSRKIIMTSDGGFLLTGITNSFNENGDVDFFLLKGGNKNEGNDSW